MKRLTERLATIEGAPKSHFNPCGNDDGFDILQSGSVAFLADGGARVSADVVNLRIGNADTWSAPFTTTTSSRSLAEGAVPQAKANGLQILDVASGTMGLALAPAASIGERTVWAGGALFGARQNTLVGDSAKGVPGRR